MAGGQATDLPFRDAMLREIQAFADSKVSDMSQPLENRDDLSKVSRFA